LQLPAWPLGVVQAEPWMRLLLKLNRVSTVKEEKVKNKEEENVANKDPCLAAF